MDKLRFSATVPTDNLKETEPNLHFGIYQILYKYHTYQGTDNFELFYNISSLISRHSKFILHRLSTKPEGKAYISTQHLCQFSDNTGLKTKITQAFTDKKGIESHSFRKTSTSFQKVKTKEISIEYMQSGSDTGTANSLGKITTIVLKRSGDGGDFANAARKRFFSLFIVGYSQY